MKLIVTGCNAAGRSAVLRTTEVEHFRGPDIPVRNQIWEWQHDQPPPDAGPALDINCPSGAIQWRVIRWPPGHEADMHRTDTVDFQTVLHGSASLILEDETVELTTGDCVSIPAVAHTWRAGPEGCLLNTVLIGVVSAPQT